MLEREKTCSHVCLYNMVVPGELTVVTGVPNSGKSEWVDALMCNLAVQHGWTFGLCSMVGGRRCKLDPGLKAPLGSKFQP